MQQRRDLLVRPNHRISDFFSCVCTQGTSMWWWWTTKLLWSGKFLESQHLYVHVIVPGCGDCRCCYNKIYVILTAYWDYRVLGLQNLWFIPGSYYTITLENIGNSVSPVMGYSNDVVWGVIGYYVFGFKSHEDMKFG